MLSRLHIACDGYHFSAGNDITFHLINPNIYSIQYNASLSYICLLPNIPVSNPTMAISCEACGLYVTYMLTLGIHLLS